MVDSASLLYRTLIFMFIFLFTVFLGIRIKKYPLTLRKLMILATLFAGIGALGRFIDLLELFIEVPFYSEIHIITHVLSVGGIVAVFFILILALERYYIPLTSFSRPKAGKKEGSAYLLLAQDTPKAVLEFVQGLNAPVLLFTRYPMIYTNRDIKVVWITNVDSKGIPPTDLHRIQSMAIRFASENENAVVAIDCLEYLLIYNEFKSVYKFLVSTKDYLMIRGATFIVSADPTALEESQVALLKREFNPL